MGQWETGRGRGSDAMADILGEALKEVGELPQGPTLLDLADAIEFVTRGMLVVELHDDAPVPLQEANKHRPFAGVLEDSERFKTIPNRGQMHRGACVGDQGEEKATLIARAVVNAIIVDMAGRGGLLETWEATTPAVREGGAGGMDSDCIGLHLAHVCITLIIGRSPGRASSRRFSHESRRCGSDNQGRRHKAIH